MLKQLERTIGEDNTIVIIILVNGIKFGNTIIKDRYDYIVLYHQI